VRKTGKLPQRTLDERLKVFGITADRSYMNSNSVNGDSTLTDLPALAKTPYRDRRSLVLSSVVAQIGTVAVAALFFSRGQQGLTVATIAVRSLWLYGAFTVIGLAKQFGTSWTAMAEQDLAPTNDAESPIVTMRHLGFAWGASAVVQAVGVLSGFGRPLLITVALCDFALRVVAFERARTLKRQLNMAAPNPLVLSGLIRVIAGIAMLFGIMAFGYSGTELPLAECAAALFAVSWADLALPKRLTMLTKPENIKVAQASPAIQVADEQVIDLRTNEDQILVLDEPAFAGPSWLSTDSSAAIELHDEQITLAMPDTDAKQKSLQ
jgi:hypothetical protein